MNTIACRSCGAQIGFIETKSGKKSPVDPDLVKTFCRWDPGEPRRPRLVLVTERGGRISGWETTATDPEGDAVEGYISHFATCTAAEAHRR